MNEELKKEAYNGDFGGITSATFDIRPLIIEARLNTDMSLEWSLGKFYKDFLEQHGKKAIVPIKKSMQKFLKELDRKYDQLD